MDPEKFQDTKASLNNQQPRGWGDGLVVKSSYALAEDQSSFLNTHTGQLTTTCNTTAQRNQMPLAFAGTWTHK